MRLTYKTKNQNTVDTTKFYMIIKFPPEKPQVQHDQEPAQPPQVDVYVGSQVSSNAAKSDKSLWDKIKDSVLCFSDTSEDTGIPIDFTQCTQEDPVNQTQNDKDRLQMTMFAVNQKLSRVNEVQLETNNTSQQTRSTNTPSSSFSSISHDFDNNQHLPYYITDPDILSAIRISIDMLGLVRSRPSNEALRDVLLDYINQGSTNLNPNTNCHYAQLTHETLGESESHHHLDIG